MQLSLTQCPDLGSNSKSVENLLTKDAALATETSTSIKENFMKKRTYNSFPRRNKPYLQLRIVLIILIGLLLSNCLNNPKTGETNHQVDILGGYSNVKDFTLSNIATDVEYIKLENNPEAQFSLGLPILHKNYILIKGVREHRLILFGSQGNFLGIIGNYGKGPGEFLGFKDVYFHPKEPKILVHDDITKKILIYTLDGKYIKEFNYSDRYERALEKVFFNQNGNIQVVLHRPTVAEGEIPLIRILNEDFEEIKLFHYVSIDQYSKDDRTGFSNFWIDNGIFYMQEFYYDKVLSLQKDKLFTLFDLVLRENHSPSFYVPRNPGVWAYNSIPYIRSVGKYFLLYLHLPKIEGRHILQVFDSESNEIFRPNPPLTRNFNEDLPGIDNDIDGFGQVIVTDTWNGKIVDILNIFDLREAIEDSLHINITHPEKRSQLIDMVKEMDVEDNPIVRIFTLKQY